MGQIDKSLPANNSYIPIVVVSFVFFTLLYKYITPRVSRRLCTGYENLTVGQKIDWDTRVNSTVHAVLASLTSGYSFVFDSELSKYTVWWDSWLVRTECAVYIGYIVVDTIVIIAHYKYVGEVFMVCHHFASFIAYYYIVTFGSLQYYGNYRLMAEFSTPLINLRWFFRAVGYKKSSKAFIINGLLMVGVFFACRISCMPHFWHKVYSSFNDEDRERLGAPLWICICVCVVLDVINSFWFYKIVSGAVKIIRNLHAETDQYHTAVKIE